MVVRLRGLHCFGATDFACYSARMMVWRAETKLARSMSEVSCGRGDSLLTVFSDPAEI
jgi:hypothetical protein